MHLRLQSTWSFLSSQNALEWNFPLIRGMSLFLTIKSPSHLPLMSKWVYVATLFTTVMCKTMLFSQTMPWNIILKKVAAQQSLFEREKEGKRCSSSISALSHCLLNPGVLFEAVAFIFPSRTLWAVKKWSTNKSTTNIRPYKTIPSPHWTIRSLTATSIGRLLTPLVTCDLAENETS